MDRINDINQESKIANNDQLLFRTHDGIFEYYWGEHIHLGYYDAEEMELGYKKKDFKQAKYDFVDEMMQFRGISNSLDGMA